MRSSKTAIANKKGKDITVSRVMNTSPITIRPKTPINRLLEILRAKAVTSIPVVDDEGMLVGVVTEKDVVVAISQAKDGEMSVHQQVADLISPPISLDEKEALSRRFNLVEEVMTTEVAVVTPDDTISKAVNLMAGNQYHLLPVVADKTNPPLEQKLIGTIESLDILKALLG